MKELALQGAEVTRISLGDYPLPIMDQDLEKEKGVPENAHEAARQIAAHDGLLIASPEYNASIPPLLKNAIDWVSRVRARRRAPVQALPGQGGGALLFLRRQFRRHARALPSARSADALPGRGDYAAMFGRPGVRRRSTRTASSRTSALRHRMEMVCKTLIERAAMMSTRIDL